MLCVRGAGNDNLELIFPLSISEFPVPEHKAILDTVEIIHACRESLGAHAT